PTPAVGIGFGIDRIARVLGEQDLDFNNEYLKVMVIPINEEMLGESLSIAKELREKGISTDLDLMGRNLSKALSYADSRDAEKAIIVGPEDLVDDEVTIKDMESGDQRKLSRGEILSELNLGD
ncbi:MAG: histidine--tRNA ligase, partial [Hadesarchaea archaeon]|nr:histidine--tRNA ligase [Hadesarchaea archaeon]